MNMFFIQFPPNYEDLSLYLVLNDERCLTYLLSVGLLPSNSTYLFWKWDLESSEYLDVISGRFTPHRQLGIHHCPLIDGFFKCLTPTPLFTLVRMYSVPWYLISLLVGCIMFVNGIPQWSVIKQCLIVFSLNSPIHMMETCTFDG